MNRIIAKQAKRWVIKIGSALLTNDGAGLDRTAIDSWVEQIADLMAQGNEVILVSSGAIAEGIARLGLKRVLKAFMNFKPRLQSVRWA